MYKIVYKSIINLRNLLLNYFLYEPLTLNKKKLKEIILYFYEDLL